MLDNMETYLKHIVYENIMFGQIDHQKCQFLTFSTKFTLNLYPTISTPNFAEMKACFS